MRIRRDSGADIRRYMRIYSTLVKHCRSYRLNCRRACNNDGFGETGGYFIFPGSDANHLIAPDGNDVHILRIDSSPVLREKEEAFPPSVGRTLSPESARVSPPAANLKAEESTTTSMIKVPEVSEVSRMSEISFPAWKMLVDKRLRSLAFMLTLKAISDVACRRWS